MLVYIVSQLTICTSKQARARNEYMGGIVLYQPELYGR